MPAAHAVQEVRPLSITLSHGRQLVPNCEYVEPLHAAHPLRFDSGRVPGVHLLHVVFPASTTLGSGHSVHEPEMV
eukprot:COSAG01_NODE_27906_length_674_cov_0.699130_2_plen_75_part_00